MRRLMWFTIGYGAVCALGTYFLRGWGIIAVGGVGLALAIAAFCLRKHPLCRRAAAVCLGVALGSAVFFGYDYYVSTPAALMDGYIQSAQVRITGYSWEGRFGHVADGTMELDGKKYRVRVYLDAPAEPGDIVSMEAKFRTTDLGGLREATFHRADGISLLLYQRGDAEYDRDRRTWLDHAAHWRERLTAQIEAVFPADTFAFAKALLLGDTTDLSYGVSTAFSVSGISHIVAVSGLHVSILCAVVYLLAGRRRFLTALLGVPVLLFFAAMVGFTNSVTRAVLMQILMMAALAVDREYDPPTALAFACLVMLTQCPLVIASVGFQLSVGSVAGIFLFYPPVLGWLQAWFPGKGKTWKGRLERWFASSVAVTLSATAVTTPLVAVYFHTVSLVSPITNLLVLFVISGIFYGICLCCLAGLFSLTAAKGLAALVSWPVRYVLGVAGWLADLPLAAVYTESGFVILWLVLLYGLLFWLLWSKKRRPGLVLALAAGGLAVCIALSWLLPKRWEYRVTVLDVGQGQCILLQSDGCTFLVDCGGDYDQDAADLAARMLMSQGVFSIDGLILTHYDRDHAGGVEYLAQRIEIERLYLPLTEDADGLREAVLGTCQTQIFIDAETEVSFGDAKILLYPAKDAISGNDSSASVLFQRGKYDTLITGDLSSKAERHLLADYDFPDIEVLLVGHHGSKYATCTELLEATTPEVAIISVGRDNSYGHPTGEVLDRLEAALCSIYRTDLQGTIIYRR